VISAKHLVIHRKVAGSNPAGREYNYYVVDSDNPGNSVG
jgi:hypothetical protein